MKNPLAIVEWITLDHTLSKNNREARSTKALTKLRGDIYMPNNPGNPYRMSWRLIYRFISVSSEKIHFKTRLCESHAI